MKKYKWNFANGLYLPMFITSLLVLFNFENSKGIGIPLTIIAVGITGSWLVSALFNYAQYKFGKNHRFNVNEKNESHVTALGACIGAPISYGLYLWWGSNLWQLVPGCILAAVIIYKWRKG